MNFKNWLKIEEEGAAPVAPASGSTTTADIATYPRPLMTGGPVRRKWVKEIWKKGLAGEPRILKNK